MRNWERKYEQLKNGEFDEKIDELKKKVEDRTASREELDEYEKLSKSKNNLKQVENVIEYRDSIKEKLKDIKNEITARESLVKANKDSVKIEIEMKQIQKELEIVEKQLRDPQLDKEEKEKLTDRRTELISQRDKNNDKYMENQELLGKALNRDGKLKDCKDQDLEKLSLEASSRISKCNMVANSLINGLSWDSIDLKLDNWNKKYTDKNHKLKSKFEKIKTKDEGIEPDKKDKDMEDIISDSEGEKLKKNEEVKRQKKENSFENRHPRLAKIGNWFKKIFKKEKMLPEGTEPEKVKLEETKPEEKQEKSFKEYIKDIAEKGMDGIKKEEKAARQEEAKKKLEEMRAANRKTEEEKFGKEYAKQSDYRNKDDGR